MTHYYNRGEFKLPGVTSIISDCHDKSGALCQWSANMVVEYLKKNCPKPPRGNYLSGDDYCVSDEDLDDARMNYRDVSKDALDIGSEVHAAIEQWLKTGQEPLNPRDEVLAAFVAFLEFFDEHKMKTLEIEFSVYGDYWAGTLDWYGEYDGKLYVWDWKTSKYHYPNEHGPQIAAYRSAVKSKVEGCGILRIDKLTGWPDPKDYSKRYEKDLQHFLLMKELYLFRHPKISKAAGYVAPF